MENIWICTCIGYLLGTFNLAYLISKRKHRDITKSGTGNLGTTNTFMNFGKLYGVLVLICDMGKAVLAVLVCRYIFPDFLLGQIVGGSMAVVGHVFPFYNKFKGGKGVASFGGLILILDWKLFIAILIVGCIAALVFNYGCCISFSAAVLFPVLYGLKIQSIEIFMVLIVCGGVLAFRHMENIKKIKDGEEMPIRIFLLEHVLGGVLHGKR